MAGAGYKLFNTGDVLTAAQVNTYLMEQTVMVFANAAARTTALSGVVSEGMISYLKDTNAVEVYDGSNWVSSDDPNAIQNTIVDAKGDLITATAADTPSRIAVGNNGETLVADSSATTGLRWQGSYAAGKNVIVNGGFDVWQRGTASSTASGAYGADRWYSYTATNVNYQRETLAVGSPTTYGIKYTSTSGTNSVLFGTALEDIVANQLRGQNVTLSFYAYCSTGTVSLVSYIQKNSTANSATVASWSTISNPTNTVTTTAQRFTVSNVAIAADSTTAGIRILFGADNFTNGANFVIYGVQLEIGAVATPFSRAGGTLAGELAACQRYYEKSYALATAIGTASVSQAFNGFYTVGSNQKMVNPGLWKVQKRTSPTVTVYDDAGNSGKISTLDTGGTATNNVAIAIIDTDDSSFRALGSSNGTQAGYKWNWVASAEL